MKIITKAELMSLVINRGLHECFEHSEFGTFDVSAMREWCVENLDKCEIGAFSLSEVIPHIHTNRVTDAHRVMTLPDRSWQEDPAIFLVVKGEDHPTHVMIDGHHRALRRGIEGEADMVAFFVPIELAIRPEAGWVKNPFFDWGDKIENGKVVPR